VIGLYDVRKPPPRERWELTAFNVLLFIVFHSVGCITCVDFSALEPGISRTGVRYRMDDSHHRQRAHIAQHAQTFGVVNYGRNKKS